MPGDLRMDIDQYHHEILRLWPQSGESPTNEIVDLCLKAVAEHPESSLCWYDLGIIIQRCSEDYGYTADDSLRCFENSVKYDGTNPAAFQELGYVLDTYFDEYEKAERAFRTAIDLGAGYESYYGLARVLAEMDRNEQALDTLLEENCPFWQHPEIQRLQTEILEGVWGSRP